jgi:DNA repair exonuclease SbcCD nuclease subunit
MFKFLHAADIHLDSPLVGLGRSEGLPAEEVRGSTRRALENLVELAVRERVAFVVIAGDVYDGDWKDFHTGLFFVRQMARLNEEGIDVYLIRGNHDAQSRMTAELQLPRNVHTFTTDRPRTHRLDAFDVVVHGQGFAHASVTDDLAIGYPAADRGLFNVGLLHTAVAGGGEHERYAPCTLDTLRSKGYAYWALGHIHKREHLYEKDPWIAFPGNVQGRHIRESGAKGCLLVTVDDGREVRSVEFRALDVLRWETCRVDVEGAADLDEILARFEAAARSRLDDADDRPRIFRVEIFGACPAHAEVAARLPVLDAQIRSAAAGVASHRLAIERVKLRTSKEPTASELDAPSDDAVSALLETLAGLHAEPTPLFAELADLKKRLGADLAALAGVRLDDPGWYREILDESAPMLLDRLRRS